MRHVVAFALLAASLGATPASAAPVLVNTFTLGNPACGGIEVFEEKLDGGVNLYMRNRFCGEVTVDVDLPGLDNMVNSVADRTFMLKPGQSVCVAALRASQPNMGYHYRYQSHWHFGQPNIKPAPYVYKLPYASGVSHRVVQGFNGAFSHHGPDAFAVDLDFKEGTPIYAAREGVVVAFNEKATSGGTDASYLDDNKANWVVVRHPDGTIGRYYHLQPGGVAVTTGQRVKAGDLIGYSGNTGHSSGPHLHFDVATTRDGATMQTWPFMFRTVSGSHLPEQGQSYTAP
jgi:hypothetical protein